MATISQLTGVITPDTIAGTDLIPIYDVSETYPNRLTKKIQFSDLVVAVGSAVALADLTSIAPNRIVGRITASPGVPEALTGANVRTICGLATTDSPTFVALTTSAVAAFTTAAESWVGPSSTAGLYFKGGNVGIGTTSPTNFGAGYHTVTVYGTTGGAVQAVGDSGATVGEMISDGGTTKFGSRSNTGIALKTNDTARVIIDSVGNVGIGTTGPSERLEVNGAIKTAAPTGGTAAAWKLGEVADTAPTPDKKIRVENDGHTYWLAAELIS